MQLLRPLQSLSLCFPFRCFILGIEPPGRNGKSRRGKSPDYSVAEPVRASPSCRRIMHTAQLDSSTPCRRYASLKAVPIGIHGSKQRTGATLELCRAPNMCTSSFIFKTLMLPKPHTPLPNPQTMQRTMASLFNCCGNISDPDVLRMPQVPQHGGCCLKHVFSSFPNTVTASSRVGPCQTTWSRQDQRRGRIKTLDTVWGHRAACLKWAMRKGPAGLLVLGTGCHVSPVYGCVCPG